MIHTPNTCRLPQYLFLLVIFLTVISAAPVAASEDLSVVGKIIEAYGGGERLAKVKAVTAE